MSNPEFTPDYFIPVTEITDEGPVVHYSGKLSILDKILSNLLDLKAPDLDLDMDKFMEELTDGEIEAWVNSFKIE